MQSPVAGSTRPCTLNGHYMTKPHIVKPSKIDEDEIQQGCFIGGHALANNKLGKLNNSINREQ